MVNPELFTAFLLINVLLVLTPGPIVTLVIATGATQGTRAALATVAGTLLGTTVLIGSVALGLSWILESSALLFETIRWAGAAYLVWLGIQVWRHAGRRAEGSPARRVHLRRGFLVGLSNPKTLAFFTAFLPQFIDPALPPGLQLAVMCGASVLMAAVADSGWAVAAGLGRTWFAAPSRVRLLERASAVALIGGGFWLSLARRPS